MRRNLLMLGMILAWPGLAFGAGPGDRLPAGCGPTDTALACAVTVTPAATRDGGVWLTWSAGGQVMAALSSDGGRSFDRPHQVSRAKGGLDDHGEARPRITLDAHDQPVITWGEKSEQPFHARAMQATLDPGQGGFVTRPLTQDPTSQRFEVTVRAGDRVAAAWLDRRRAAKAKQDGKAFTGLTLMMRLGDQEFPLVDQTCECCHPALAPLSDGRVAVVWRHIFDDGIRDHGIMIAGPDGPGPVRRLAVDDWKINSCPHQGPTLAVDQSQRLHVTWFTQGAARKGVFYAHSREDGSFSAPMAVGRADRQAKYAQVLASPDGIWLVWKEFDGETAQILAQHSHDDGASFGPPRPIAQTRDGSDYPQALVIAGQAKLGWLTKAEGWRLFDLKDHP